MKMVDEVVLEVLVLELEVVLPSAMLVVVLAAVVVVALTLVVEVVLAVVVVDWPKSVVVVIGWATFTMIAVAGTLMGLFPRGGGNK
jgi:hypothetical protein